MTARPLVPATRVVRCLKQLTMKRCSDSKCELVFPQLIRELRKLLEKCFRGDVKCISFTIVN